MAGAFRRSAGRYVARFQPDELGVVIMLLEQTRELLDVPQASAGPTDEFEFLMRSAGWGEQAPPSEQGGDPAVARLIPDPNPTDPQASAEFRRLTGTGLRERKAATISAAVTALSRAASTADTLEGESGTSGGRRRRPPRSTLVSLSQEEATSVLVALTDVRLVLGVRLGLTTDSDPEEALHRLERSLDTHDPAVAMAFAYDFLTWLQESLTRALMR
ncbi:MAG: DUF2017 domain-containing protein [Austwickia sp.]|jgi:hypothetical protein|nr:DUF2017 domain-containing protein [Austwickia sp.]MBK8435829.1 DUF2017 domain-containing protein [Austwickia sp.]